MQQVATGGALDHHTRERISPTDGCRTWRAGLIGRCRRCVGRGPDCPLRRRVRRYPPASAERTPFPHTSGGASLARALRPAVDPGLALRGPDGEIRTLRCSDVDFEAGRPTISWTMAEARFKHGCSGTCGRGRTANCRSRVTNVAPSLQTEPIEGRWVLARPKAYKPRVVPLTCETLRILRDLMDGDGGLNPARSALGTSRTASRSATPTATRLRLALKTAGIDRKATVHWLRHTYTTMAEHASIEWVVYAGISGHAAEGISRRYTHQLEQEAQAAIGRLDQYLRGAARRHSIRLPQSWG